MKEHKNNALHTYKCIERDNIQIKRDYDRTRHQGVNEFRWNYRNATNAIKESYNATANYYVSREYGHFYKYKPIRLFPVLGKIYQRLINISLTKIVEVKNLPKRKFKDKHTTTYQLMRITDMITRNNWGKTTTMICLGLEAAFDTVL